MWEEKTSKVFSQIVDEMCIIVSRSIDKRHKFFSSVDTTGRDFEEKLAYYSADSLLSYVIYLNKADIPDRRKKQQRWSEVSQKIFRCKRILSSISKNDIIHIESHLHKAGLSEIIEHIIPSLLQARNFSAEKSNSFGRSGRGKLPATYFIHILVQNMEELFETNIPRTWDIDKDLNIFTSPSSQMIFELTKLIEPGVSIRRVKGILGNLPSKSSQLRV